jgi:hypothetical protein
MNSVPDNAFWYHAAYAVAIVTYVLYGVSIWWRRRALDRAMHDHGAHDEHVSHDR